MDDHFLYGIYSIHLNGTKEMDKIYYLRFIYKRIHSFFKYYQFLRYKKNFSKEDFNFNLFQILLELSIEWERLIDLADAESLMKMNWLRNELTKYFTPSKLKKIHYGRLINYSIYRKRRSNLYPVFPYSGFIYFDSLEWKDEDYLNVLNYRGIMEILMQRLQVQYDLFSSGLYLNLFTDIYRQDGKEEIQDVMKDLVKKLNGTFPLEIVINILDRLNLKDLSANDRFYLIQNNLLKDKNKFRTISKTLKNLRNTFTYSFLDTEEEDESNIRKKNSRKRLNQFLNYYSSFYMDQMFEILDYTHLNYSLYSIETF
jgi:hypothetical protein